MLFNSLDFIIFLPVVFLLYWFVFKQRKWQNLLIVIASYIFYGWWDWRFLMLIAFTSVCSYYSGIYIEKCLISGKTGVGKIIGLCNILINLFILGVFKYCNFFIDNLVLLMGTIGIRLDWPTINVILPVGISFYTFQALSYTIDVYRKNIKVTHDPIEFAAFISFFPQLVAGPIERATNLLPQFQNRRIFDYDKAVDGCRQMLWGFFKKIVIADNCALAVDSIWGNSEYTGIITVLGAILFTFQIYCDFSGYSDIAIGCARLFGISLMRNFDYPYFSRSIPEFWRRWHISLTTWFRDYIYFPLGGSKCERWKTFRNIVIVWGVSGLWHGANWTFVCWGLYHALLLIIYNLLGIKTKNKEVVAYECKLPNIKEIGEIMVTFVLAVFGWVMFRSDSLTGFADYISRTVTGPFIDVGNLNIKAIIAKSFIFIFVLLIVEWVQRRKKHGLEFTSSSIMRYSLVRYAAYSILLFFIILFAGEVQTFIYFQF